MSLRLGLGLGLPNPSGEGVGGWGETQLTAYLASLSDGLYFDTTKTDRFFQENTGPTLADDVGEAMGLALDQRLWGGQTLAQIVAAASEVAPALSAWNFNAQSAYVSSEIVITGDGATDFPGCFCSFFATTIGAYYRVEIVLRRGTTATAVAMQVQDSSLATLVLASTSSTSNTSLVLFFRATSATSRIGGYVNGADVTGTAYIAGVSCKRVPGNHGVQATGTLKPVRQTDGAKFDGSDDNWLTPYLAAAGNNCIVSRISVPATLAGTQVICGSNDASDVNAFRLTVRTSGLLGVKVGGTTVIDVGPDLRGTDAVIGVSTDGTTIKIYANEAEVYSLPSFTGSIPTAVPLRVGARNDSGTANVFFAGAIKRLIVGRDHLALDRYLQIRNALLAA